MKKIISFTDLDAWKEGHVLVLMVYKITNKFPQSEEYGLKQQLRRASVSITSNVAEGFSRQSYKEKTQFYILSRGSITETQNQILIARDVQYINESKFNEIAAQTVLVSKITNGLIKATKQRIPHHNS
jgi:four helix bundle protein